jgi:hypothetical protein
VVGFCLELGEQDLQVAARERPFEGLGGLLVSLLEARQVAFEGAKLREVVWCQNLTLDDREADLDLVEPTGVNRRVDENEVWPFGA